MNASPRLDLAIQRLEEITDSFEGLIRDYEEADANYKMGFIKARARALGTLDDRKYEAERTCMDLGVDGVLRAARVRLEANKERSRNIRATMDALRSLLASERVSV